MIFHTSTGGTITVTEHGLMVVDPKNQLSFYETRTQTVRTLQEPSDVRS